MRQSEVTVERISVCNVTEKLIEQGKQYLPCSYTNDDRFVSVAAMTSYWLQSDVIGMPFCLSTKHNSCLFPSCYSNRSMSPFHL